MGISQKWLVLFAWKGVFSCIRSANHVLATYQYAVELFAYLCQQYKLNLLADGVIISHSEGCRRGIAE